MLFRYMTPNSNTPKQSKYNSEIYVHDITKDNPSIAFKDKKMPLIQNLVGVLK